MPEYRTTPRESSDERSERAPESVLIPAQDVEEAAFALLSGRVAPSERHVPVPAPDVMVRNRRDKDWLRVEFTPQGATVIVFEAEAQRDRPAGERQLSSGQADVLLGILSQIDRLDTEQSPANRKLVIDRVLAAIPSVDLRDEAIGPFYDTSGLRTWLGLSRQRLAQLVKERKLLGLQSEDAKWLYPSFQFGPAGELLPRLNDVMSILSPMTEMTIALWLNGGLDEWEGRTAAEMLHLGGQHLKQVMAKAHEDAARRQS